MNDKQYKRLIMSYTAILILMTFGIWDDITTGRTFSLWLHIITVVLVLGAWWSIQKSRNKSN
jgi:hypothetical protein